MVHLRCFLFSCYFWLDDLHFVHGNLGTLACCAAGSNILSIGTNGDKQSWLIRWNVQTEDYEGLSFLYYFFPSELSQDPHT